MRRRSFLAWGAAAGTLLTSGIARADAAWIMPERVSRPSIDTDEGGLWALMDREEGKLRRSPFTIRDKALQQYVQEIVCRLAGEHCADIRVHLVHNRYFNANMAPNGMMQVWSGLMLRVDNEAQLAAVLGHEIGHYLQRHSVERLRDAKARSAFGQFLGMLGLPGMLGQLAVLAGGFAYSRDHERQADRIGLILMSRAGYDPAEAAKIWENLLMETKARHGFDPAQNSPMFATHPPMDERKAVLQELATNLPRGVTNEATWLQNTAPYRREWLNEEIKRGQFNESIALLNRLITRSPTQPDYLWARAEVYRLRATEEDLGRAMSDYEAAIAAGSEPAETHRGMGLIYRQRKQVEQARASFDRYLQLEPNASDAMMIKSYVEETGA